MKFSVGSGFPEKMRITSAGNVGINTTTPFEKLQTNGNIYAENRIISADATNANQNLLTQADIKISNQNDIYGNLTKVIISPYEAAYTSDGTGSSTIRLDSETAMTPGAIHTFSVYYKDLIGSISIDLYDVVPSGSYTSATGTTSAPASGRLYGYAQKASTGAGAGYNFVDINLTNNGSVTLLNPKVETGKVVTEFIATTEEEGIPQTLTTNNLRATGSIQMGADDTTASAAKVGTMRYRTGTEYVEVTGVDLADGWTFTSGWNAFGGGTSITNSTTFVSESGQGIYAGLGLTTSKTYKVVIAGTQPSGGYISIKAGTTGTLFGNISEQSFDKVLYATLTTVSGNTNSFYIRLADHASNTSIVITKLEIQEVTEEDASYADMCMQTGSSTYEWVNIVRNTY